MSEENVARLQPVYAEWAKGNVHAGLELLEPDVVFRAFDAFEDEDLTFRGTEAIADFIPVPSSVGRSEDRGQNIHCGRAEGLGGVPQIGDRKAQRGRGGHGVTVWTFRGERVSEIRWLRDRSEALEAAGLSE
jgi:ketosteroid isomerase-like protein